MADKINIPVLILGLITIVLAIYTFVGMRWWHNNSIRWLQWVGKDRFRVFILLVFTVGILIALIFVPMLILGYLMNDAKLVSGIGHNGRFVVLLGWSLPTFIYTIVYLIRKTRTGN
jgi:hypothetical protein